MEAFRLGKPNSLIIQLLEESLVRLTKILEYRKEELRDCNRELSDISDSLDDCMNAWYSDISSIKFTSDDSRHARSTAFIVPCPNLHPIPYDILRGLIEHSPGKVGLTVCIRIPQLHFSTAHLIVCGEATTNLFYSFL